MSIQNRLTAASAFEQSSRSFRHMLHKIMKTGNVKAVLKVFVFLLPVCAQPVFLRIHMYIGRSVVLLADLGHKIPKGGKFIAELYQ